MIEHVDRAIERFLREKVPLEEAAVAISFDTPDREWSTARTRPTVNAYLWEISRSAKGLRTGMELRVDDRGARQRRPMTPIVDLHYVVSAWASERRDEHQLLGSLLECVLAHPRLPDDVLAEPLAGTRCGLDLAAAGTRPPSEVWNAFGGGPRPALQVTVSLPLEVFRWQAVAPEAEVVQAGVVPRHAPAAVASEETPVLTRRRQNGAVVMEGHSERRNPA